jgi:hypothetical protein
MELYKLKHMSLRVLTLPLRPAVLAERPVRQAPSVRPLRQLQTYCGGSRDLKRPFLYTSSRN